MTFWNVLFFDQEVDEKVRRVLTAKKFFHPHHFEIHHAFQHLAGLILQHTEFSMSAFQRLAEVHVFTQLHRKLT